MQPTATGILIPTTPVESRPYNPSEFYPGYAGRDEGYEIPALYRRGDPELAARFRMQQQHQGMSNGGSAYGNYQRADAESRVATMKSTSSQEWRAEDGRRRGGWPASGTGLEAWS